MRKRNLPSSVSVWEVINQSSRWVRLQTMTS